MEARMQPGFRPTQHLRAIIYLFRYAIFHTRTQAVLGPNVADTMWQVLVCPCLGLPSLWRRYRWTPCLDDLRLACLGRPPRYRYPDPRRLMPEEFSCLQNAVIGIELPPDLAWPSGYFWLASRLSRDQLVSVYHTIQQSPPNASLYISEPAFFTGMRNSDIVRHIALCLAVRFQGPDVPFVSYP